MAEDVRVLGQVADQLDHEPHKFVSGVLVDWVRQAVLDGRDLWLMDEVLVELWLGRHVAEGDASRLNQVDFVLLSRVEQVNQGLDLAFLSFGQLHVFGGAELVRLSLHEVLVRRQVGQGNRRVLDGVLIELAVNGLEQVPPDVFFDELVPEVLVETEVCEVSAALSVLVEVFGVLEHHDHEVDGVWRGDLWVAVQDLGDVGEAGRRIQHGLRIFGLLSELDDRLYDVGFDRVILHFVLGFIKELFVGLVVLEDELEALADLPEHKRVDLSFLFGAKVAVVAGDVQELVDFSCLLPLLVLSVRARGLSLVVDFQHDIVVGDLLVQPLEGDDELLSESEVGALQFDDAGFVLGELPAYLDCEVRHFHRDALHLREQDLNDLLVVGKLLAILLEVAREGHGLENVLLREWICVQELFDDDLDQIVVLLEGLDDHLHLGEVPDGLGGLLHDLERVRLEHLLDHDLRWVLTLGNELVQHLRVVRLQLDLLLAVELSSISILIGRLKVIDNLLDRRHGLQSGCLSDENNVLKRAFVGK